MSKYLDKFDAYTISTNSGFKIAFGDYVISLCCHNELDAMDAMEGNGRCGERIKKEREENGYLSINQADLSFFTFGEHNAELRVFDQKTDECLTSQFIEADDDQIAYGVSPSMLLDVLIKVRENAEKEEREAMEDRLESLEKELARLKELVH